MSQQLETLSFPTDLGIKHSNWRVIMNKEIGLTETAPARRLEMLMLALKHHTAKLTKFPVGTLCIAVPEVLGIKLYWYQDRRCFPQ
jgi:hypothetical protein